ncbi:hypothetical protein SAMN04488028_102413 [Reichenbachiella agariperforans]|uniref:Oligosaccharide repeat unit polymerase n=1 Tax=Reichenbachiella agariperforans TaxID=156994 RepID=A0A1M6NUA6_REIAG|nr:hypothetical protein [Reichenbachiella agariperforans]SHJ99307.1 hypothetical protein SAMN04488028_102413 [Reichenbachiella agariperforans]
MANPYYIYCLAFGASLIVCQFGWSSAFPELKANLLVFLFFTFILTGLFGFWFQRKNVIKYEIITISSDKKWLFIFSLFLWSIEFIYNKGIPLVLILSGADYDYTRFGIPTFHVFVVTYTSFLTVHFFSIFLSTGKRKILLYSILLLFIPILLFNRGMFMINTVSCFFVYYQFKGGLRFYKKCVAMVFLFTLLFGFGYLGNVRTTNMYKGVETNYILEIGKADASFKKSIIPDEYFWSYLYIGSPIGNLQHNINQGEPRGSSLNTFITFVTNELNFDFIAKRINELRGVQKTGIFKFLPFLTVGCVYTKSFMYFGWFGIVFMFVFLLYFPVFYFGLIKKGSEYYSTASAIVCSLYCFLIFDNMFSFSGMSLQLVYPILLRFKFRKVLLDENPGML